MEKAIRLYDINFVGLAPGEHVFEYQITDEFFEKLYPESLVSKADCHVKLLFDKQSGHFELSFLLEGVVDIDCDRCTAVIHYPVFNNNKMFIKFEGEADENNDTDEVMFISRNDSVFNVAQLIYEYINLSVPLGKNCDYLEERYKNCNQEVLKLLAAVAPEPEIEKTDERWSALKNIKLEKKKLK